jgi:hypothetical protein
MELLLKDEYIRKVVDGRGDYTYPLKSSDLLKDLYISKNGY